MKLKNIVLAGIAVLSLVTLAAPTVYARRDSHNVQTDHNDMIRSSQLAKEGYVFRLDGMDKADGGLWSQPAGQNKRDLTSIKTIHKIIKNHVNFKIYRVWHYKNGMQYKVTSRSGQYRGWIDDHFIYNKYSLDKQLQPIIYQERKVVGSINTKYPFTTNYQAADLKAYRNDLTKAGEEANQLTGNKKPIALKSVRQVKGYIKHHNDNLIPTLLWQRVK